MQASILDIRTVASDVQRRLHDSGVRVAYSAEAETAYATKNSVVLPMLKPPATVEDIHKYRYLALHETGHIKRKEAFDILESRRPTENYHGVWNILEDQAQERDTQAEYMGDRLALMRGYTMYLRDNLSEWRKFLERGGEPDEDSIKRAAVYALSCASRDDWHTGALGMGDAIVSVCGAEAERLYHTLVDEGWLDRVSRNLTPLEVADIALELHQRLWPDEPSSQEPPPEGEGTGEGESSEDEKDSEGKGAGKPEYGGSEDKEDGGAAMISWRDLMKDHDAIEEDKEEDCSCRHVIDYAGWSYTGRCEPYPDELVQVRSLQKERGSRITYGALDKSIANQLRRYIQSTARSKWETERTHGRINKRALKRIAMGTHEHNRRIFQRRTDAPAINTAVSLLVDASGSMGCGAIDLAAAGAALMSDCFGNVLRVPVEVLTHTTSYTSSQLCVDIGVAKAFNEHVSPERIMGRVMGVRMHGNADGDALLATYDRIIRRPEPRKIIIMLTDGEPSDAYRGSAADMLTYAIKEVRGAGVEVYGIGIQHHRGELWFGDEFSDVQHVSDLPNAILETARRFVHR